MNRLKNIGLVLCGLALGLSLSAPAAQAVESLKATLSTNRILVDGQEVRLTAYNINGNNYVMLRDIGKAVGFEVYWDSNTKCVQVESEKPYTGEAPRSARYWLRCTARERIPHAQHRHRQEWPRALRSHPSQS